MDKIIGILIVIFSENIKISKISNHTYQLGKNIFEEVNNEKYIDFMTSCTIIRHKNHPSVFSAPVYVKLYIYITSNEISN